MIAYFLADEIPLDDINDAYAIESLAIDTYTAAKHYGLSKDLFRNAFFIPGTELNVFYDIKEDDLMLPVCRGNEIYPSHVCTISFIYYSCSSEISFTHVVNAAVIK